MKAIEESSIAIVVLSTHYASSTWCLNELLKIMECKNKSQIHVFPILYNVEPSDVRKQQNSFFKAFAIHEKDKTEMVKSWKEALKELTNLAGEDIRGKNEASCIKEIVDKILRQLPVKASEFKKSCVGLEYRISDIKKLMNSKPNEVIFIGLWGMGGIGKTTTARAIFEDCKNKFDGSCFLQDVRQSKDKLHNLQKNLLLDVLNTKIKGVRDVIKGSSMIQERLKFKKVLLVIDDVDDVEQLNALAKQCDWFGRGSRIIITTRDERLINDIHITKYVVPILPTEEAFHLFSLHAFKSDHPPEDYKKLSLQVLRYVAGLPLAIQVLGNHLYRREKCVWESTLSRLKSVPDDKIISKLQISFDGLNVLQQNIFLDICCFFRGHPKRLVVERLQSLGLHPTEGIDILVEKSLIHFNINNYRYCDSFDCYHDEEDGEDMQSRHHIDMHDLLQEMGLYIVRQRSNWDIRRYTRLWLGNDIVEVLSDMTVSSDAERIYVGNKDFIYSGNHDDDDDDDGDDDDDDDDHDHHDHHDDNDVGNGGNGGDVIKFMLGWEGAFRNMNKLSFLEINGDFFKGNYNVDVSQSSGQLKNKLRWFSWSHYPGHTLPKSFHHVNLVHLHMKSSNIEETPDFSHMPNLEVLNLYWCGTLVYVHPSLGDHMKIKRINLALCKKLKEFPKMNRMKSLEILNLSDTNLQSFPEIHGNLNCLRKLILRGTSINGLPASIIGSAPCIQELKLDCRRPHLEEYISLEALQGSFQGLVSLEIIGSSILRTLDFSYLPCLEKLDLFGSEELVEVHPSLGVHKRIKSINLSHCSRLEEFPRIADMNSLEKLNLSCTSLQSFPEMTGIVNPLVTINLAATEITAFPWWIEHTTGLEIIGIQDCEYFRILPATFVGLRFLRIYFSSGTLKYFKENIIDEAAVPQEIELHSCKRKRGMTVLEGTKKLSEVHIYFRCCGSLEELPESLLSRVKILIITDCPALTIWICFNLEDLLGKYQHLCHLQLHQVYDTFPQEILQAFSEWESMSNMLRKRKEIFEVHIPGRQIPSWFQYQISRRSVTVFLPLSSEWLTDELRGFVLSGINADLTKKSVPSASDHFNHNGACCCRPQLHLGLMYIPIDTIRGKIRDWDGQKECTLIELISSPYLGIEMVEASPRWGLSLVYSEGEVDEVDPDRIRIETYDCPDSSLCGTFRVKIAGR